MAVAGERKRAERGKGTTHEEGECHQGRLQCWERRIAAASPENREADGQLRNQNDQNHPLQLHFASQPGDGLNAHIGRGRIEHEEVAVFTAGKAEFVLINERHHR